MRSCRGFTRTRGVVHLAVLAIVMSTAVLIEAGPAFAAAGDITTIAGDGTHGFGGDGGAATQAQLASPYGVVRDGAGNLFMADSENNRVRKVDTAGVITTVAGDGNPGYGGDGGPATAAELYFPIAVALDGAGNLYIADYINNVIRKVDSAGIITTVAGDGTAGYGGDGGPATAAQINSPWDLALDPAGNLYFTEALNYVVRKVNTAGTITTVAGTPGSAGSTGDGGPATAAQLLVPTGLTLDGSGNLYVSEVEGHKVRKIRSSGTISTVAGTGTSGFSGDGGLATAAKLDSPNGLAVSGDGSLFIADTSNHRIRKVRPAGTITTVVGTGQRGYGGDGGPALLASLRAPTHAVVIGNDLLVSDTENDRIRRVEKGALFEREGPKGDPSCSDRKDNDLDGLKDGADPGCRQVPYGSEGPPGDPSCSDGFDNDSDGFTDIADGGCQSGVAPAAEGPVGNRTCVDGFDNDADGAVDAGDPNCQAPPPPAGIEAPAGSPACADGIDNDGDGLVDHLDRSCLDSRPGDHTAAFEELGPTGSTAQGITRGPDGNLWYTMPGARRVGRITPSGVITEFPVGFLRPFAITAGPDGNLWFTLSRFGTGAVAKMNTSGVVVAQFPAPAGLNDIVAGPDGNLWFPDRGGSIGTMTTEGVITEFLTAGDPDHITTGPDGNLWFTERDADSIGRITPVGDVTLFPIPQDLGGRHAGPFDIIAGADGNLWFTMGSSSRVGKITPGGVVAAAYATPTPGSGPGELTVGPDGNMWFTNPAGFNVTRLLTDGRMTEVHTPSPPSGAGFPAGIAAGPDGKLWFPEGSVVKIANLDPTTLRPIQPCRVVSQNTVLTQDVGPCEGDGIVVAADGITVDLNGHKVLGTADTPGTFAGIRLESRRGVTVKGGTVSGFDAGVFVEGGSANTLTELVLKDNIGPLGGTGLFGDGIVLVHSSWNRIARNTLSHNGVYDNLAILGLGSNANRVEANVIETATDGDEPDNGLGSGVVINGFFEVENPNRGQSIRNNDVVGNTIRNNVGSGFSNLSNVGAIIEGNAITGNGFRPNGDPGNLPGNGLGVQSLFTADRATNDVVRNNTVTGNLVDGIQIISGANRIEGNKTSGNNAGGVGGFDLADLNQDCDSNAWWRNDWGSAGFDPGCVTLGGKGPGPSPPHHRRWTNPAARLALHNRRSAPSQY